MCGPKGPMPTGSRPIDRPIVPRDRIPAENTLATVEQASKPAAGRGVLELPDAVADIDRCIAHDVESLLDSDHLIDVRIGAGKEFRLVAEADRRPPLVGYVDGQVLAVRRLEIPGLFPGYA